MCDLDDKEKFKKAYDPGSIEGEIYKFWKNGGFFDVDTNSSKEPYVIALPPPNITGNLHLGHAFDNTLEDIIIRYKRLCGFNALAVPGTDHAAIATEAKVVQKMHEEGLTKESLGRAGFMERTWAWKEKYGGNITKQMKELGISCDWRRERFTMDDGCSRAVNEFFVRLYKKGLIYRGKRMVNWCPCCSTSLSDIEVEYLEREDELCFVKYKLDESDDFLCVATTRPETIFGDTGLAVNPRDERFQKFIGKTAIIPFCERKVPIVADNSVKPEFGTGILKITPAHAVEDFEIGQKNNLESILVIDKKGILTKCCGQFSGMERFAARSAVVSELRKRKLLEKTEKIKHNVGFCYRCSEAIEPRISTQWFVKMEPLAKRAIEAVKNKKIKFIPERFSKVYFDWLKNIKDWCISRQIWWGHRVPAWHCRKCKKTNVSLIEISKCIHCGSLDIFQDEDTLDTWFSSALWPFSVFGWPEQNADYEKFFPTTTLVTGYDIIFFWAARMIFASLELTDKVPFENILVHGLVRDFQGQKMSKSLGNGIDPLDAIKKYGADALRFALVSGTSPGGDTKFSKEKLDGSRNFVNKLWNAARCVDMLVRKSTGETCENSYDIWILSRINFISKETHRHYENFEIDLVLQKIYGFFWYEFCDWYLEFTKISGNIKTLMCVFKNILIMFHPFVPFVTEKIWQNLQFEGSCINASYPAFKEELQGSNIETEAEKIIEIIKSVRVKRNELEIPPSKKINLFFEADENIKQIINKNSEYIKKLANVEEINFSHVKNANVILLRFVRILIPTDHFINKDEMRYKTKLEIKSAEKQAEKQNTLLANTDFTKKAPPHVVAKTRETLAKIEDRIIKLKLQLNSLN
jgi:valyl-tRNA synthetase